MPSASLWQIAQGTKSGEKEAAGHTCLQMVKIKNSLNICSLFIVVVIVIVAVM